MDSSLRKAQLLQLDVALEIKRICERNGIQYFLIAGTLLGAVRHQGFIPWDDDLDIGMLRSDYERFITACATDLDERFFYKIGIQTSILVFRFPKLDLIILIISSGMLKRSIFMMVYMLMCFLLTAFRIIISCKDGRIYSHIY